MSQGQKRSREANEVNAGLKRVRSTTEWPESSQSRGLGDRRSSVPNSMNNDLRLLRSPEYDRVSHAMWVYYSQNQQFPKIYAKKLELKAALYAIVQNAFPYCGLYMVGSSMNGFGSRTSDMDLCLMLSQYEITKSEAIPILLLIQKSLRRCSFLQSIQLIPAKVPILKFCDKIGQIESDLNINNAVGIRNTHLLYFYSRLDRRLSPLVLFVKYWARCQNINDASQATISSYSLALMIIHYLQCACSPPVLPSLQQLYPESFTAESDVRTLTLTQPLPPYVSPNSQSLGELFMGFLNYYSNVFDYRQSVISVRLARTLSRESVVNANNNVAKTEWKHLCIEEPFDLSNTARSVHDEFIFMRIKRVFQASYSKLRASCNVEHITLEPV